MKMTFRWLGVAGLEISAGGHTLLIDPFFTRPSAWAVLSGQRVQPDVDLVMRHAPRCDHLLITHAHYDHLMDAPVVMQQTGAPAYGSPNTCAILRCLGLPESRIHPLHCGQRLTLGPWQVEVLPAWHVKTPLDWRINGPLPPGLRPPLNLLDYRMDEVYSFVLTLGEWRILVGNTPVEPVDSVFVAPFLPPHHLRDLLLRARPRRVMPIHWDDFWRPLSQPLRPLPLKRLDLNAFRARVQADSPNTTVFVPQLFAEYPLFRDGDPATAIPESISLNEPRDH